MRCRKTPCPFNFFLLRPATTLKVLMLIFTLKSSKHTRIRILRTLSMLLKSWTFGSQCAKHLKFSFSNVFFTVIFCQLNRIICQAQLWIRMLLTTRFSRSGSVKCYKMLFFSTHQIYSLHHLLNKFYG